MVDKRVERNSRSLIELRDLLRRVCESPHEYVDDAQLRLSLKSQGALAKFSREDLSILASSINTTKRIALEHIEGGYEALDNLRRSALQRLEECDNRPKKSNKRTRVGLAKRVAELEKQIDVLEAVNYALIQSLTEAVSDIRSVAHAESEEARVHRSREACKRLVSMVAINPSPFDQLESTSNVAQLRDG